VYPTRGQIKTRWQNILDDPSGSVFNETVFAPAFGEAFDSLYAAMLTAQCPRIELVQPVTVTALTTQMTPAQMGITDFGDFIYLRERPLGSSDKYRYMGAVDVLPQRQPSDMLRWFNWRNNTFYFIGANQSIDLEVKYESSGTAPTDDNAQIMIDSSLSFLSNYAVGVAGERKGYETTAQRCMLQAVGPKYLLGSMGGQLYMLIQPLVRSRQNVQIAHRPFQAGRRLWAGRAVPYVQAQQGTTGGGANNVPVQFSTITGTISGLVNGVNPTFVLNVGDVFHLMVFVDGIEQTIIINYTAVNNVITFEAGSIPNTGQIVTAEAYLVP
jgi:hypothetical protein